MRPQDHVQLLAIVLLVLLASAQAWASELPRTSWGDPNLQGVWTNTTTTPLERPDKLGTRKVLTDQERAALDRRAAENADRRPRKRDTGSYNSFWLEKGGSSKQSALIVKPADGKLPRFTLAAQSRVNALAAARQ